MSIVILMEHLQLKGKEIITSNGAAYPMHNEDEIF